MSEATRRFARGAGWLYAYRWLERLLDFLAVLVLARRIVQILVNHIDHGLFDFGQKRIGRYMIEIYGFHQCSSSRLD